MGKPTEPQVSVTDTAALVPVPFFVVSWPPNLIISDIFKGISGPDPDEKLAPNIGSPSLKVSLLARNGRRSPSLCDYWTKPTGRISGISLEALLYESRNVYFYLAETCINEYGYCCLRRR